MKQTYKLLITTSGTGSRLKEITKNKNKALVVVGGKTALAHILDRYDKKIPIVITLGYLGEQVVEYMEENYPDRKVEYVDVDKYEGEGSSCGYSILCAKEKLQCPFIFHACDTIVFEPIPSPLTNWTAGYHNHHILDEVIATNYTTQKVTKEGKLVKVNAIGEKDFKYVHMGITAVNDYEAFWETLTGLYSKNPQDMRLTDINVINKMIEEGFEFNSVPFNVWLDVGNMDTLQYTNDYFSKRE